ncbi:hypothetical protein BH09VER1_BH09VER1_24100 [soil metagenome]
MNFLQIYTLIHVLISLVGIASGFLVVFAMLEAKSLPRLTALFLVTTALTSITGFFFPFKGITPGIIIGILSLLVLAPTFYALYGKHLVGVWRKIYVITAVIALYFNTFVLIAQSFQKVPALKALAPTGSEPPFAMAQGTLLIFVIILGIFAAKRFRPAI